MLQVTEAGVVIYQCKACDFSDESCAQVRTHYVEEHPDQLPILCGYCRERLTRENFREHHMHAHAQHPLKVRMHSTRANQC